MKKSDGITKTAPRLNDKTADWYRKSFESLNAGLEYTLEATPDLYRRTLYDLQGKFTRGELMLMLDAMNGHRSNPHMAGIELGAHVVDRMALENLDKKWGIPDRWAFNKKLADLSYYDRACLEIWVQAFWAQKKHDKIEEYVAALATNA